MSTETIICGGCWDGEDAAPIWGSWSVGNWVLAGAWILVLLMSIRIFWRRQPGLPFSLFAFFSVAATVGFVWQELFHGIALWPLGYEIQRPFSLDMEGIEASRNMSLRWLWVILALSAHCILECIKNIQIAWCAGASKPFLSFCFLALLPGLYFPAQAFHNRNAWFSQEIPRRLAECSERFQLTDVLTREMAAEYPDDWRILRARMDFLLYAGRTEESDVLRLRIEELVSRKSDSLPVIP